MHLYDAIFTTDERIATQRKRHEILLLVFKRFIFIQLLKTPCLNEHKF